MEIHKLTAARRTGAGKGPSRRLRREGQIPAIAYGNDIQPQKLAVSPKALAAVLGTVHGRNSVLELQIDDKEKMTAMVRQYSHDPVSRAILHADFLAVDLSKPVDVVVPFKLVGKCKGVTEGGVLLQVFRTLPVRSLPEKIPAIIELDVTELGLGESTKTSGLQLPEGVSVLLPAEQTIAVVNAPDKKAEAEAAAEAAAAASPAAAAAAKPGAAAPKADDKKKK